MFYFYDFRVHDTIMHTKLGATENDNKTSCFHGGLHIKYVKYYSNCDYINEVFFLIVTVMYFINKLYILSGLTLWTQYISC